MLIQLNDIKKGYGVTGAHSYRPVLDGLNWSVEQGMRMAIVGPSGSGKTTLLNLIGTLDTPEQGKIFFKDQDITRYSKREMADFRNDHLGFIFQAHYLLPQLTLMENVMLPLLPRGRGIIKKDKQWAEYLVKNVGLWNRREQKPAQLSGGECQRTAVVRALINKPQLLLADEPTGALDEENASELSHLLVSLNEQEGVTLIAVTHSTSLASCMSKQFCIKNGQLVQSPLQDV